MKKYALLIIGALVLLGLYAGAVYNQAVPREEAVNEKIHNVQVELGRQAQLLPNLAETTSAAARFEQKTFVGVAEGRTGATAMAKVDPTKIANNPDLQRELIEAQAKTMQALTRVSAAVESNPDLKATGQFAHLSQDIAGSQNRVTWALKQEQAAFVDYNTYVRHFPRSLVLGAMGFHPKPYYDAGADAQVAPKLHFDN